MRTFDILLLLANLLALLVLIFPLPARAQWLRTLALAPLLAGGLQMLVEGPRWQMVPAYGLAVAFGLVWLLRTFAPESGLTAHRWINGLAVGLGVLSMAVSALLPALLPVFRLPLPSGPHAVGTLTYHWVDAARAEVFTADAQDRRELMVQIWYPAEKVSGARGTPYIEDPRALRPLLDMMGLPGFVFDHLQYVETHAVASAPAVETGSYPVLVFSAGRGGFRQEGTHLFEELASHGYVVASIDSPYASSGVIFPDGRMVPLHERLLPGPTGGIPADLEFFNEVAIPYLAQDVLFTLDQLAAVNQNDPNGILTGRLDMDRAGMLGVSLGGLVGAEASSLDSRLKALISMDVHMPPHVVQSGLTQPVMFIGREAHWMEREKWPQAYIDELETSVRSVYDRLPGDGYLVLVEGMFHTNHSDAPLYSPLMRWVGVTGPIDARRSTVILDEYTLAFFDKHLKGEPAALLDGPSPAFPEVRIQKRRP